MLTFRAQQHVSMLGALIARLIVMFGSTSSWKAWQLLVVQICHLRNLGAKIPLFFPSFRQPPWPRGHELWPLGSLDPNLQPLQQFTTDFLQTLSSVGLALTTRHGRASWKLFFVDGFKLVLSFEKKTKWLNFRAFGRGHGCQQRPLNCRACTHTYEPQSVDSYLDGP